MAGSIQGTFGWSNAPLAQGMREAEQLAARGASGVSKQFESLFKRTPGRRAVSAVRDLVGDLASGDLATAVTGFAGRLSGLGLAAGVGIGASIAIFTKFKEQVDETAASERRLANELASLGGTRGPEEIAKKFEAITSQTDDLIQKSGSMGSRVTNFLDEFVNPALGTSSKHTGAGQSAEIASGFKAQGKLLDDRAAAEEKIVMLREAGLKVSERQAAVEKILHDAEIKKSAIAEEALKYKLSFFKPENVGKTNPADRDKLITASQDSATRRSASVDKGAQLAVDAENQKFDIKSRAVEVEQDLANMAFRGVQAEQQKLTTLSTELGLIEDQLHLSKQLTGESRQQLLVSETKAKTALRDEQLQQFLKAPQQLQRERRQAEQHQRDIKRFNASEGLLNVHRDMSGNVIGGTDPTTGEYKSLNDAAWEDTFPRARMIALKDDTDRYYKNLIPQDAGDLERGPMGTNRLGFGKTELSGFGDISLLGDRDRLLPFSSANMLFPFRSTNAPQPEEQMPGDSSKMVDVSGVIAAIDDLKSTLLQLWQ